MKFDMHCHTKSGSIDSRISIKDYISILKEQGFDGMLVTDHDSYRGYENWLAHKDEMPDFKVIRGIEYDTKDAGHFIVIMPEGVKLKVLETRGMSVEQLVKIVHENGGVLGPAHPYGMKSSSAMLYRKMKKHPYLMEEFDFLEGFNACEKVRANKMAQVLAAQYGLQCVGGSDSHVGTYVGMGFTEFDRPIETSDDMIASIKERGIVEFGGEERVFLNKHKKRNRFYTTWSFRAFNTSLGILYTPLRKFQISKISLNQG